VTGETHVAMLDEHGDITERTLTPDDFGLKTWDMEALKGGCRREESANAACRD